jgi:very-short-patch-repair endonuclease
MKSRGIYFAPLPVVIRGGKTYERLEPDFLVIDQGVTMVVEVDGDTVHRESPAEAHTRTQGLAHHGVRIERVRADDCLTRAGADICAQRLATAIARYRTLKG